VRFGVGLLCAICGQVPPTNFPSSAPFGHPLDVCGQPGHLCWHLQCGRKIAWPARFLWRGTQGLDLVYRQGHYIELCYKYEIYFWAFPAIRVSMLTLSSGPLAFWLWPHEKCCQWHLPGLLWYFMWCPWHGKGNPCCIIKALSLRPLSHSVRLMAADDTHLSDAHPWIPKMGTSKYLVWHWLA